MLPSLLDKVTPVTEHPDCTSQRGDVQATHPTKNPDCTSQRGTSEKTGRKRDRSDIGKTGNLAVVSGDGVWVALGHEF